MKPKVKQIYDLCKTPYGLNRQNATLAKMVRTLNILIRDGYVRYDETKDSYFAKETE